MLYCKWRDTGLVVGWKLLAPCKSEVAPLLPCDRIRPVVTCMNFSADASFKSHMSAQEDSVKDFWQGTCHSLEWKGTSVSARFRVCYAAV